MVCSALSRLLFVGISTVLFCCVTVMVPAAQNFQDTIAKDEPKANKEDTVDLLNIYQQARQNDASFATAQAIYKADTEKVPQARSELLPQLSVKANTGYNRQENKETSASDEWNTHGWSAVLNQPVFDVAKWLNLKVAHSEYSMAEITLAIAEQNLVYDVASRYFAVLKTQDEHEAAKTHLRAVQKQLDQTRERFKVGIVANTDVQEAQASYDKAVVLVITAKNNVDIAREDLQLLTNRSIPSLYKLNQRMPVSRPEPDDISEWTAKSMTQNLTVKKARQNMNMHRGQLSAARAGHLPVISGAVSYSHAVSNQSSALTDNGRKTDGMLAELTVEVPVFSGGMTASKARAAGYNLEASERSVDEDIRVARKDTYNSYNSIRADVSSVKAWCQSIISAASSLDAIQSGYEVGTRTIIDVFNGQDALYDAQKQYLDSRYSYILNTLKLKQIAGTLSPTDLESLNHWLAVPDLLPDSLTPYCKTGN